MRKDIWWRLGGRAEGRFSSLFPSSTNWNGLQTAASSHFCSYSCKICSGSKDDCKTIRERFARKRLGLEATGWSILSHGAPSHLPLPVCSAWPVPGRHPRGLPQQLSTRRPEAPSAKCLPRGKPSLLGRLHRAAPLRPALAPRAPSLSPAPGRGTAVPAHAVRYAHT